MLCVVSELSIPVPWGEIRGKVWGPDHGRPVLCLHGWADNCGTFNTLIPLLPKGKCYCSKIKNSQRHIIVFNTLYYIFLQPRVFCHISACCCCFIYISASSSSPSVDMVPFGFYVCHCAEQRAGALSTAASSNTEAFSFLQACSLTMLLPLLVKCKLLVLLSVIAPRVPICGSGPGRSRLLVTSPSWSVVCLPFICDGHTQSC